MAILKMPDGLHWGERNRTTGMDPHLEKVKSHSPDEVMRFLHSIDYDLELYKDPEWDCEDMAYLGVAEARCRFPGQPMGVAIGKAKVGKVGESHALIVVWFEDQGKLQLPRYFDPTLRQEVDDFETEVLIPFPISGSTNHRKLPKFENWQIVDKCVYAFDAKAGTNEVLNDKFDLIKSVKDDLRDGKIKECSIPQWFKEFWSFNDRTFLYFSRIRKEYKGAPVGVAFGQATHPSVQGAFDYSTLVLWERPAPTAPIIWDINDQKDITLLNIKFGPRLVLI